MRLILKPVCNGRGLEVVALWPLEGAQAGVPPGWETPPAATHEIPKRDTEISRRER